MRENGKKNKLKREKDKKMKYWDQSSLKTARNNIIFKNRQDE